MSQALQNKNLKKPQAGLQKGPIWFLFLDPQIKSNI